MSTNIFQEGLYSKEVTLAEVDNIIKVVDSVKEALSSSEAISHKRGVLDRLVDRQRKLRDELTYVVKELGIDATSIYTFADVFCDEVMPDDKDETVADMNSSHLRYRNFSGIVKELKELAASASGNSFDRVLRLIEDLSFTKIHIAKVTRDMELASNARHTFEKKRESDKKGFKNLRDQFLAVSEMRGYVDALRNLVTNYPSESTTSHAIQTTLEQFDRACVTWRRYSRRLYSAVKNFKAKYEEQLGDDVVVFLPESQIRTRTVLWAARYGISETELLGVLHRELNVVTNSEKGIVEMRFNPLKLLTDMGRLLDNKDMHPRHYMGVAEIRKEMLLALDSLGLSLSLLSAHLEIRIEKWSGGKAKASTNPAVKKIFDKAQQNVTSPVYATQTSPLTYDAYVAEARLNFQKTVKGVEEARNFLEQGSDKLQEVIQEIRQKRRTRRTLKVSFRKMRRIARRKRMPVKDNRKTFAPVEDAVRAKVRARYGGNVPFEDEVLTSDKKYVKEVDAQEVKVKDPETGAIQYVWALKSDVAAGAVEYMVDNPEDVGS